MDRKHAREILAQGKWLSTVENGSRGVMVLHDTSFDCYSTERFDPEFRTTNMKAALDYLFPN